MCHCDCGKIGQCVSSMSFARMPMGTVYMVLNYNMIDYKFHLKYEKNIRQVPLNQVIIP